MSNRTNFHSKRTDLKVLYCGDLAPDDFMWSVSGSSYDLFDLLLSPVEWVNQLGSLPDWKSVSIQNGPTPPPVLTHHFQIRLAVRHLVGDNRILFQGISETGIVRVSATNAGAISALRALLRDHKDFLAKFDSTAALQEALQTAEDSPTWPSNYWPLFTEVLGKDGVSVDTIIDPTDMSWFGHLRIFDPRWDLSPYARATWISCFLLMSMVDPYGYTNGLTTLYQQVNPVTDIGGYTPSPNISFTYAGEDGSNGECCDAIYGTVDPNNSLAIVDSIVKNYMVVPPPPSDRLRAVTSASNS